MTKLLNRRRQSNKNFTSECRVIMIGILSVILLIVLWAIYMKKANHDVVAIINNESVTLNELQMQINHNKSMVSAYFNNKYKAEYNEDFWITSYEGEIPIEKLMKDALDDCIRFKIQQILAKEKGLVNDINYNSFLNNLRQENERRKNALENDEVIFGPRQYEEKTYFDVVSSNMIHELKELILADISVSEDECKNYYEENKEKSYISADTVTIQKISISYALEQNTTREEAEKLMKEMVEKLKTGASLQDIISDYSKIAIFEELTLGGGEGRNISLVYPMLVQNSINLAVGQFSDMFEENNAFCMVVGMDRVNNGFQSYDNVKDSIRNILSEEKYNNLIDNEIKKADISIKEKVYKRIEESILQ